MKETRTVMIDTDEYQRFCEHAQALGKTAEEAVQEAISEFIADTVGPKLKAHESQGQ